MLHPSASLLESVHGPGLQAAAAAAAAVYEVTHPALTGTPAL